jgi:hypothetical protein
MSAGLIIFLDKMGFGSPKLKQTQKTWGKKPWALGDKAVYATKKPGPKGPGCYSTKTNQPIMKRSILINY